MSHLRAVTDSFDESDAPLTVGWAETQLGALSQELRVIQERDGTAATLPLCKRARTALGRARLACLTFFEGVGDVVEAESQAQAPDTTPQELGGRRR